MRYCGIVAMASFIQTGLPAWCPYLLDRYQRCGEQSFFCFSLSVFPLPSLYFLNSLNFSLRAYKIVAGEQQEGMVGIY